MKEMNKVDYFLHEGSVGSSVSCSFLVVLDLPSMFSFFSLHAVIYGGLIGAWVGDVY